MNTTAAGTATRIPAPRLTSGRAPASRANAQVIGAARAPISANGNAEAQAVGPSTARNGTWTSDASGIQCALLAIGRPGFAGIEPPRSTNVQTKSMLNPRPASSARATLT